MPDLEPAPAPPMVETLEELVHLLDLVTVRFYEIGARWDDTEGQPEHVADEGREVEEPLFEGEFRTAYRKRGDGIDYRVSVRVPRPTGQILVDAAAMYVAPHPFETTREALLAFGEMVAAMTVLPYLRQAVMDMSIRVDPESPVVLPVIQRGAITFGLDDEEEDIKD